MLCFWARALFLFCQNPSKTTKISLQQGRDAPWRAPFSRTGWGRPLARPIFPYSDPYLPVVDAVAPGIHKVDSAG